MNYVNIDDNKLKDLMKDKENTILIDVRSEEEYEEKNIQDSINIPLNNLLYSIDDIEEYKEGGNIKEELETPEIEETNQKNLIPEGALHKNKHHMEHTEGLTQKGIPVVDNDGEQ